MERGSLRERMQWVARLYDIDGDGFIGVEELEDVIYSVNFYLITKKMFMILFRRYLI